MKPSYWNRLASSLPFVRLRGNTTANVRYRDTFAPRPRVSLRDAGNSDKFDHPLNMLSKRLLILPAFVAIILMVMVFLGISWLLRGGQLLLPRNNSSPGAAPPP